MATASPPSPTGFEVVGTSAGAPFAAIADESSASSTACSSIPRSCTRRTAPSCLPISCTSIAGIAGDWTMGAYRDQAVEAIRRQVGNGRVICGLSGGVDSSVAAVLIHEAIGERLTCIFVDHGLMRKSEAADVVAMFREHYNIPLVHVDAAERFLTRARGRGRSRGQAQDDRPAVHRGVRGRGRKVKLGQAPTSWPRARSIPTSSRACPSPAARR